MENKLTLSAAVRAAAGKNANRRLRAAGFTPAVFYDATGKSLPLQVNEAELAKLYARIGRTTVFDLEIDGDGGKTTRPCLIWDIEYYPTRNRFQHIDFYGADPDRELKVRVPLAFTGTAKGIKLGGKVEIYRENIDILCKPAALPKKIFVDISGLDVGQGLRIADLALPEGVRARYDVNFAVLTVNIPGSGKGEDEEGAAEAS
ncbi:MAG: 50S ribosomal protein L25/general stress protein Ctc [Desulfovibrio sp.]|jgi:large subunit ribosomal protein L25|nr:50S ribosomal protein L25/general stress protein Ctc [Desulfovibrio sp.]